MIAEAIKPTPVANIEMEYVLIAALLFDGKRIEAVSDILDPTDFADPFFGRLFGLMQREASRGTPLNAFTIRPYIEADPGYQEMGGAKFLAEITSAANALVKVKFAAQQVADLARRRRLITAMTDATAMGADINEPLSTLVDAVDAAVMDATATRSATQAMSAAEAMQALLKATETPQRIIRSKVLPSIDNLLGGMRAKQMVIGAGRPGMGKTATALSYALGAAQAGHGVLFVSLEMSIVELSARVASDLAFNGRDGVPYADINSENPSRGALRAIGQAASMLEDIPLHIIDAGSLTLARLEMYVRRYKRRLAAKGQSLDLVVVDYLQLLRCDDKRLSAYEAVSEISRRLKALAKDQDVCVFALAQLSREAEKRTDKRPQLSDLRDSGQIEQDADAVLFLYRHEYYLRKAEKPVGDPGRHEWEAAIHACTGKIDFICGKRRNGPEGAEVGDFHGAYQAVRG